MLVVHLVAKRPIEVDLVRTAPALPASGDVTRRHELVHDRMGGALSDLRACGNLTEANPRVTREAQ